MKGFIRDLHDDDRTVLFRRSSVISNNLMSFSEKRKLLWSFKQVVTQGGGQTGTYISEQQDGYVSRQLVEWLRVLLKTFKFSGYSCTKEGFTCNANGKGAKYSQVMHEDVKSIRLNSLAQSVTFLIHFLGAGTPTNLNFSWFYSVPSYMYQNNTKTKPRPHPFLSFPVLFQFRSNIRAILPALMTESVCKPS